MRLGYITSCFAALVVFAAIPSALANTQPYTLLPTPGSGVYGQIIKYPTNGVLNLYGGHSFQVISPGPFVALKNEKVNMAVITASANKQNGQADISGEWQFIQADVEGQNVNNGYLLIQPDAVSAWVSRLGGNFKYVDKYLKTHGDTSSTNTSDPGLITLEDLSTLQTYSFYSMAEVVTESGSQFGPSIVTSTGERITI